MRASDKSLKGQAACQSDEKLFFLGKHAESIEPDLSGKRGCRVEKNCQGSDRKKNRSVHLIPSLQSVVELYANSRIEPQQEEQNRRLHSNGL
jgi:hypothetical protein